MFDPEATSEIVLRAEYILIVEGGSLNIGSEQNPYLGQAVIELYGNIRSIKLPNYGAKVRITLAICVSYKPFQRVYNFLNYVWPL